MTRSILTGLFAVVSVTALGLLPSACQSSGIGDPCTPEDEYNPLFGGFKVTEDNIESRSFQCESRICLVNHFQGRVSCPLGQPAPKACKGTGDTSCANGGTCTEAATYAPYCDDKTPCPDGFTCQKLNKDANQQGNFCACDPGADKCPTTNGGYTCDAASKQCKSYVCHTPGDCQDPNAKADANKGKSCCVPGDASKPIASAVCGQCDNKGGRDAASAVYCSCRCGVAEGAPEEPNFHFCECPDGFECSEIRRNLGIGDPLLSGKYCIKKGTGTTSSQAGTKCGAVTGFFQSGSDANSIECKGTPSAL
jgi:hypothetical protein